MTNDLRYINAALTRTGNSPITSLTQSKVGAVIASENYEIVVKNELALTRWKLPSKVEQLNLLDPAEVGEPPEPWGFSYQLPSDFIQMRTVMVGGQPISFERMGQLIFCDFDENVKVYCKYLWRPPEDWWPPEFAEGIVRRMEAIFLRGIKEDYREAEVRDDAAEVQFAKARALDAQSQSAINPVAEPTMAARGSRSSTTLRARRR